MILDKGNKTLYRWELMMWEGVEGAHVLCVHIIESQFPTWNIYHAEVELSLRVI
jgi:hypothetical protein